MSGINRVEDIKIGVGLRPTHYPHLENQPKLEVNWFEAISENFMDSNGRPLEMLEFIRSNYPVALHGVSLNLANPDGLSDKYLDKLGKLVERIEPLIVSDHLCWTGTNAHGSIHDLLPLPYTQETVQVIVRNIESVQTRLKRPLAVENVSTYLRFKHSEMTEWDFVSQILKQTGCQLLLDVNNIYVNSQNHGFDPKVFIDAIPAGQVSQIHLAGHTDAGDYLFDTHSSPVSKDVWDLFEYTIRKISPSTPILIEWDEDIPEFNKVQDEAKTAKQIWRRVNEQR